LFLTRKNKKGVTLVELMITVTLILLGLIPLLKMFISAVTGTQMTGSATVADNIAKQMLAEISQKKWDEHCTVKGEYISLTSASDPLGTDAGEDANDKTTFDDIDDYKGWEEIPPRDLSNKPIPGYEGYQLKVDVIYVTDPTTGVTSSTSKTDFKQVTVTVSWQKTGAANRYSVKRSKIFYNGIKY